MAVFMYERLGVFCLGGFGLTNKSLIWGMNAELITAILDSADPMEEKVIDDVDQKPCLSSKGS